MFKFFFFLVAVTTVLSMGIIGKIGKISTREVLPEPIKPAPMVIEADGGVSFPGRVPSPEMVYRIRNAILLENVEALNELLVANRLFVAPEN